MLLCLRNARVILPDRILDGHSVLLHDDVIVNVFPDGAVELPTGTRLDDLKGRYLGPGFIDIHCHGGGGFWIYENPAAAHFHLQHGTTSLLATTRLLETHEAMLDSIRAIRKGVEAGLMPNVIGIHMEGPYLNPDYGAYRERSRLPKPQEYLEYAEAGGGLIKTWTLAPELEYVPQMIADLQTRSVGQYIFSVGHSAAAAEQIYPLIASGLRLATHCTNASGCALSPSRYAGTREFGVDEAVWLDDGIYAEVIPDRLGCHVRPLMLQLIIKAKGVDRTIIVSDSTVAEHSAPSVGKDMPAPSDVNWTADGGLMGSALTMDLACANVLRQSGLGLVEVFKMASYNPATALGLQARIGQIAPGCKANLLVFDYEDGEKIELHEVFLEGKAVERKES